MIVIIGKHFDMMFLKAIERYVEAFTLTPFDLEREIESVFNETIFNDGVWIGYDLLINIDRAYSRFLSIPEVSDDETDLLERYKQKIIAISPNYDVIVYPRS